MTFATLNLIEPLHRALKRAGYRIPTPIQEQAIPELLKGKDLIGIAQTGTGKTAAFTIPLLQRLEQVPCTHHHPRALILAPTRELASQIGESLAKYGQNLPFNHAVIFGGVGQGAQVKALRHGVDVLVATPGRLLDLKEQGFVKLQNIEFFILDEADRMLDMGFIHDMKRIAAGLPEKRQTILFSATMSPPVEKLARGMLRSPVRVAVTPEVVTVERIDQRILFVDQKMKERLLKDLLKKQHLERVLVFTRTKHRANKLARILTKSGIAAAAIHGDKTQSARTLALRNFQKGRVRVLVATDVAARGIDIDGISHVINFELPDDPENYVHRIGRTARAGSEGTAYSFCASHEREALRDIERFAKISIEVMEHSYHSDEAKNATGAAARRPPRGTFQRSDARPRPRNKSPMIKVRRASARKRTDRASRGSRDATNKGSKRQFSSKPSWKEKKEERSPSKPSGRNSRGHKPKKHFGKPKVRYNNRRKKRR